MQHARPSAADVQLPAVVPAGSMTRAACCDMLAVPRSHVVQQYPLQLEDGFMVHNDGACIFS
jgi:hypothetical protein